LSEDDLKVFCAERLADYKRRASSASSPNSPARHRKVMKHKLREEFA